MTLGACGAVRDSALNPTNWFGRSTSESVEAVDAGPVNPLIPASNGGFLSRIRGEAPDTVGQPFGEIVDLTIERVSGGAIVRVTGRADRQGIYAVQLVPSNEEELPENGVLTYRLVGLEPARNTAVGTPATREVTAARNVTLQKLRGVRAIRVEGASNARVSRR